jgi:hypothetical protein
MSGLPAATRTKLVKTLTLLESPVAGERDAAGLAACRILAAAGLTWADLVKPRDVVREPQYGIWRETCRRLMARPNDLRPWEVKFVSSMPAFPRISTKQRWILDEIARRVLNPGDE